MYGAESEALAALEVLAHLSSFAQMLDYVCVKARIPDDLILDVRDIASLPSDWRSGDPIMARMLGTRWIADQRSPVLRVPSVVIPREANYVLNPEHPDFGQIEIGEPLSFDFDVRIVARLQ